MRRSNENYLRWNLGRSVTWGYTPNVTLISPGEDLDLALEPGEAAVARIELCSKSQTLLLTDQRLLLDAITLVRFGDVTTCFWIDRNKTIDTAIKREKYHRMILEVGIGREIIQEGLGNAVFPLLAFFRFHLHCKGHRN